MTALNRHQPDRPRMIDNIPLDYRTLPIIGDRFTVTNPFNMIAAARLYRAVRRGDVPNFVAISDLHEYLFPDNQVGLSKKTMGAVVIRTVRYNPRKLLGVSKNNDKMRVIYSFGHILEFQYGLEWMICTWLRKFLNDQIAPGGSLLVGPEAMDLALTRMVECDDITFANEYESRLWDFKMPEPDWNAIAFDLEEPEWRKVLHDVERKPLRSYR